MAIAHAEKQEDLFIAACSLQASEQKEDIQGQQRCTQDAYCYS
jgi:hypothetical protein